MIVLSLHTAVQCVCFTGADRQVATAAKLGPGQLVTPAASASIAL